MGGTTVRRAALVPVLAVALLHSGCATAAPRTVRFLEPEGARVELRGPRGIFYDRVGMIPFQTRLTGGAWVVDIEFSYRNRGGRPPLRGVLVVREVAESEEVPLPVEFRLSTADLDRIDASTPARCSFAAEGRTHLRFKGGPCGFDIGDPEIQEWLADTAPAPEPPGGSSRPAADDSAAEPPLREADEVTWGTVVLVIFLIPVYVVFAGITVVRGIFGAGPP